jgi:hypothetical protein
MFSRTLPEVDWGKLLEPLVTCWKCQLPDCCAPRTQSATSSVGLSKDVVHGIPTKTPVG